VTIRLILPGARELAEVLRDLQDCDPVDLSSTAISSIDPFGVDDPCISEGMVHRPIADCREVVCAQCGKVFWQ
jgi:hypothetical protein